MGHCVPGEEAGAGDGAAEVEYGEFGGFDIFVWVWGGGGGGVVGQRVMGVGRGWFC